MFTAMPMSVPGKMKTFRPVCIRRRMHSYTSNHQLCGSSVVVVVVGVVGVVVVGGGGEIVVRSDGEI